MTRLPTALQCLGLLLVILGSGGAGWAGAQNALPQFLAEQSDGLSGLETTVELKCADGSPITVVEVLSGTTKMTSLDRAKVIASRMQALTNVNPRWWDTLQPGAVNHQVIICDANDGTRVMTADDQSRKKAGFKSDSEYALFLLDQIKQALSPKLR